jgi:hypothetical protein
VPSAVEQAVEESRITKLPVDFRHAAAMETLPPHHGDPFDRMLIAQALAEGATVVTHDRRFEPYRVPVLRPEDAPCGSSMRSARAPAPRRVHGRLGAREEALRHRRRFTGMWKGADPPPLQLRVERARSRRLEFQRPYLPAPVLPHQATPQFRLLNLAVRARATSVTG